MTICYCVEENKDCVWWVEKYFQDCLCNLKDDLSFAFGLISMVCWGVAEIPQIITNFRTKSSHGVSLAFLLTWIAGDVFNLVGCLLEPATIPTQYYTALLYTTSTVVLVLQSIYYDHIKRWCRRRKATTKQSTDEDQRKPLNNSKSVDESGIPIPRPSTKATATPRREFYYTSARSLAGSGTPPFRTYLRAARSGPSAMVIESDSSSDDEATVPLPRSNKSITQPRPIPKPASYGTFLAASINLPLNTNALTQVYVGVAESGSESHTVYGQWLGWMMAAIYMGGRLPQIWLNIKRGSVEGLNPLMFIFAMIANLTYVGSILVRSTEWKRITANMPWLLDAVVCVALDVFIILQYIYYRYWRKNRSSTGKSYGDYYEEYDCVINALEAQEAVVLKLGFSQWLGEEEEPAMEEDYYFRFRYYESGYFL